MHDDELISNGVQRCWRAAACSDVIAMCPPVQGHWRLCFCYKRGSFVCLQHGFYAATICVPKKRLYACVKSLQKLGGSGVLVQPMTYIFDEEPQRWRQLLEKLGIPDSQVS